MTRRKRVSLIVGGFVIFAVLSPAAILLARGYYFDFATRRLVLTGALMVKTDPKNAAIILNRIQLPSATPLTKRFLIPGEYFLEIHKSGYRIWKKRITIYPEKVTYLPDGKTDKIPLFLENPETTITSSSTDAIISTNPVQVQNPSSADAPYYLAPATAKPGEWQLWQKLDSGPAKVLLRNIPPFAKSRLIVSPDKQVFMLLDNDLYRLADSLLKINSDISFAYWNRELPGLVYGNNHEVWLYSIDTAQSELVTRSTQTLSNVIYNGAIDYIFLAEGNKIKGLEVDPLGQPNVYTFAETKNPLPEFAVNPEGNKLVYKDGKLFVTLKIR